MESYHYHYDPIKEGLGYAKCGLTLLDGKCPSEKRVHSNTKMIDLLLEEQDLRHYLDSIQIQEIQDFFR